MSFLGKKIRLLWFLLARVRRYGWSQLAHGLRDRRAGYTAMECAGILPAAAKVIVDVGAHHGDFAAALDLLYRPDRIWLVEPNPQLTGPLRARFSGRPQFQIVPQCLGEHAGEVSFHLHEFDAASSRYTCQPGHLEKLGLSGKHREVTVPMTTLDQLMSRDGSTIIDLLKLDCQGGELGVLQGAAETLPHVRHVFCEVEFDPIYAGAPLFGEVHRHLSDSGFALVSLSGFAGAGDRIQWADALYRNLRLPS